MDHAYITPIMMTKSDAAYDFLVLWPDNQNIH